MRSLITLILCLIFACSVRAQYDDVCQGDVILTTQAEVNAFRCAEITGSLIITGPDIYSLASLEFLEKVGEHLIITDAPNILSLNGLEGLRHVTCSFEVKSNENLRDIRAVSNLKRVGRNLTIIRNPELRSVDGIGQIDSVLNLQIFENPLLDYCCELAPIVQNGGVYGNINIYGNGASCTPEAIRNCSEGGLDCVGDFILTGREVANFQCRTIDGSLTIIGGTLLDSLKVLQSVTGDLTIEGTSAYNLNGLQNLRYVGGTVTIRNNPLLFNIQSLLNLQNVGGDILVENNEWLSSVRGIETIENPGGDLVIQDNPLLDYCCELDVLLPRIPGTVLIVNNGSQCTPDGIAVCDPEEGECIGDVYVNNQEEAEAFDCQTVTGDFTLMASAPFGAGNLPVLKNVEGDFYLRIDYEEFTGLENVQSVGGILVPGPYFNSGASINLDGFSGLETLGGFSSGLVFYDGQLSSVTGTVHFIDLGYATRFENPDWIPQVNRIDSLVLTVIDENVDTDDLFRRVPEDGDIYISSPFLTDLSGLSGKSQLNSLDITSGQLESLAGMEDLRMLNKFSMRFVDVDDCCPLYGLLTEGSITDFTFEGNTCTIDEILENCAPPEVMEFSVYPNPVNSGNVTVDWEGDEKASTTIQVLDNFGKLVYEQTLSAIRGRRTAQLEIDNLPNGTYLVRIITGEQVELRRMIRE